MDLLNLIYTNLQPLILEGIGLLLTAVILYVTNLIRQKTGLDIEARHREALHSALMTGVVTALRDGPSFGRDVIIDQATSYARQSVPDAIKRLAPSSAVLSRLADRYVGEALDRLGDVVSGT
jgi:hypothetical protein